MREKLGARLRRVVAILAGEGLSADRGVVLVDHAVAVVVLAVQELLVDSAVVVVVGLFQLRRSAQPARARSAVEALVEAVDRIERGAELAYRAGGGDTEHRSRPVAGADPE